MHTDSKSPVVDCLSRFDELVEVGVGNRPTVAGELAARGCRVTTTDLYPREVPSHVDFVVDDVTDPDLDVYRDASAVYALNCPPELQRPLVEVARDAEAAWFFTTLGTDPVVVDAVAETLPGTTLFGAGDRTEAR